MPTLASAKLPMRKSCEELEISALRITTLKVSWLAIEFHVILSLPKPSVSCYEIIFPKDSYNVGAFVASTFEEQSSEETKSGH